MNRVKFYQVVFYYAQVTTRIEAKNSELKNVLRYDVVMGNCLYATKIQGACTIFAANIKRIFTILDEK